MIEKNLLASVITMQTIWSAGQNGNIDLPNNEVTIDSLWSRAGKFVPAERIFIHTDSDYYSQSDTIWLRAYMRGSVDVPEGLSNFIYVELINDRDSVISTSKIIRTTNGFYENIAVEHDHTPGGYTLPGYTYWMLNLDKLSYFYKPIFISSSNITALLKENSDSPQSERIIIERKEDTFYIELEKEDNTDEFISLYSSNGPYPIERSSKQKEIFSRDATKLPFGEMVVAIIDHAGQIKSRSSFSMEPKNTQVDIKSNNVIVEDTRKIILTVTAPQGDYSLSVVKESTLNADRVNTESLSKSPTIDFERTFQNGKHKLDHYFELEQVVSGLKACLCQKKNKQNYKSKPLSREIFYEKNV